MHQKKEQDQKHNNRKYKLETQELKTLIQKRKINTTFIYTDGSSIDNPGPAGIGVQIEMPLNWSKKYKKQRIWQRSKGIGIKTNNYAELKAISMAIEEFKMINEKAKQKKRGQNEQEKTRQEKKRKGRKPRDIYILTDSTYVVGCLENNWYPRNNLREVLEIQEKMDDLSKDNYRVKIRKIRAHEGIEGNEEVDGLARTAAMSQDCWTLPTDADKKNKGKEEGRAKRAASKEKERKQQQERNQGNKEQDSRSQEEIDEIWKEMKRIYNGIEAEVRQRITSTPIATIETVSYKKWRDILPTHKNEEKRTKYREKTAEILHERIKLGNEVKEWKRWKRRMTKNDKKEE